MLPSTRDIKTGRVNVSENVVLVSTQLFVALAPKKIWLKATIAESSVVYGESSSCPIVSTSFF